MAANSKSKLVDAKMKLFRNCAQPEGRAQLAHIALGIRSCRADSMTVLNPNSEEIDTKTATTLMVLKRLSWTIRFSLFLSNQGDVKQHSVKAMRLLTVIPVEINIHGPVQSLNDVGRVLSDAGMFLQEPSSLTQGVIYQNPHFLSWDEESTTPLLLNPREMSKHDFANSIEEVVNFSKAVLHPPKFEQDRRIKTILKRFDLKMAIKITTT